MRELNTAQGKLRTTTALPDRSDRARTSSPRRKSAGVPAAATIAILTQVQKRPAELGVPRENVVFVSGIGCSSRFPYYMNTYGFHGIHGRAPAIAMGVKCARPELSVWVVTGDGDSPLHRHNHLIHCLRRNVDVKILLFNNRIYGLTKGQYSPTSEFGKVTKSSPLGTIEQPIRPVQIALAAEATFVARTIFSDQAHLMKTLEAAARHKGASFVEILQSCRVFNDEAFDDLTDRADGATSREFSWSTASRSGSAKAAARRSWRGTWRRSLVDLDREPAAEKDLLVHDCRASSPALAALLAASNRRSFPRPWEFSATSSDRPTTPCWWARSTM